MKVKAFTALYLLWVRGIEVPVDHFREWVENVGHWLYRRGRYGDVLKRT